MFYASSLGPSGAAACQWGLCGCGRQDHPRGREQLLPCQAQASQEVTAGARPHLAGHAALLDRCWCKSAAAGLLAASLTLPLLVIHPPLVQTKTPWSSKHNMDCALTLGAHAVKSSHGSSTLQRECATVKPSVPFMPDTTGASEASESYWELSSEEGTNSSGIGPGALELRHMETDGSSLCRQVVAVGMDCSSGCLKGDTGFHYVSFAAYYQPCCTEKTVRGVREMTVSQWDVGWLWSIPGWERERGWETPLTLTDLKGCRSEPQRSFTPPQRHPPPTDPHPESRIWALPWY